MATSSSEDQPPVVEQAPSHPVVVEEAPSLTASNWQNRRDAWQQLKEETLGGELATSLGKEANANVLDAALEGLTKWAAATGDVDAFAEGGLAVVVSKGLGSSRAATAKRAAKTIDAFMSRGVSCEDALLEGLGSDTRRGGGRVPTACARLLARHVPAAEKLTKPLAGLFDAASADARLAAAELVLAMEHRNPADAAAFLDTLGPSAKKAVDRARQSQGPTAAEPVPAPKAAAAPAPEPEEVKAAAPWSTAEEFWSALQTKAAAAVSKAQEEDTEVVFESWAGLFERSAWIERKAVADVVGEQFRAVGPLDVGSDAGDLIAAMCKAGASESHAKVAPATIEALASIVRTLKSPHLFDAKIGVFPTENDEPPQKSVLLRAKDKRFGPPLAGLLAAFTKADPGLPFDPDVQAAVSGLCTGAKKLPPFGRALFLDWIGDIRLVKRRPKVEAYVKLAQADAADAFPALRTAAASALATLIVLGDLDSSVALSDKRLKTKVDDLLPDRRSAIVIDCKKPKATNKAPPPSKPPPSKGPVQKDVKKKAQRGRPASAPGPREKEEHRAPPRASEPVRATRDERPWYPTAVEKHTKVQLKEVVPNATRTALGEQKDKDSWKRRRDALDRVLTSCRAIARSGDKHLEAAKDVKQLIVDLRPRLADPQAKLRPLACEAIANVLFAVAPRDASARLGKLAARCVVGAVLDASRGVRKPAFYALDACVGRHLSNGDTVISVRALADAAQHLGSALAGNASPAAKPEVLDWLTDHVMNHLPPHQPHHDDFDQHLVLPLLTLMNDKAKDSRDKSQACLLALVKFGVVSPDAVVNAFRDMIPATKRALKDRVDDVLRVCCEDAHDDDDDELDDDDNHDELPPEKPELPIEQEEPLEVEEAEQPEKRRDPLPPAPVQEKPAVQAAAKVSLDDQAHHDEEDTAEKVEPLTDGAKVSLASSTDGAVAVEDDVHKEKTDDERTEEDGSMESKRGTTFEEHGTSTTSTTSERFSETGLIPEDEEEKVPPAMDVVAEETSAQKEKEVEVPAAFHFDPSHLEDATTTEEDLVDLCAKSDETADELFDRALADLAEGAGAEAAQSKEALKAVVYVCSSTKDCQPHRTLSDAVLCEAAAATLARTVDRSVKALAGTNVQAQRFARLSIVAALAFARSATLRRGSIRELLSVATKRAADPALERDRDLRTALNDLAVAAALATPRGDALAAVLDLLAKADDRLVTGQLARVVHLTTSEDDKTRSFWAKHTAVDPSDDVAVAKLIEPLVLAAHTVLEESKIDDARRIVFDAAKTLVALLTTTVGLDMIHAAGSTLPKTSVLFEFAAKLADDDHHQDDVASSRRSSSSGRPSLSTSLPTSLPPPETSRSTTSLKERLHHIKRGRGPIPTAAAEHPPSSSTVDSSDPAARIAELRRRLAASAGPS